MPGPEIVTTLVQRFHEHSASLHSPLYNEAQLRQEYLNPFFEALGWDVYNKKEFSIQYREVVHEDSIHVKGSPTAKAPDYAFRLGGLRKFFVEAKKPAEDIENTKEYAYQLKSYAWSLGLPLSILTDFEEFAVYDCRNKPNPSDSTATSRVMYIRYDQYEEKWDEIAQIFSPQGIQKGAFDRYVADNTAKKGTTKVDDAFLADIETWRASLARNIALRNTEVINERRLNFAVQMTIDRIIFLRISEDRGIEPEKQLYEICSQKDIYSNLLTLFQKADLKYNSGLFHFRVEKGNGNQVDTFTPTLFIDDKVLKEIIRSLYYPCPYVFKEIPVEILGQVYEQFLGKVIRLTPGKQAKIEEKPEVRKAGGVYYTPKYIVDYIVANTVGKLLEGKTPAEASKLKIVDPACGSGSFLLGAFQYLMDWHEKWYQENDLQKWTKSKDPTLVYSDKGDLRLSTSEKKRILTNNIYGVDIDAQAVEVTKLSLLLKVLEEETGQLTLAFERALPDLGENIKCGNSLIGWNYFQGQLLADEEEILRVNPFDWEKNFPEVFAQGGFDAIIGNPPYRKERDSKDLLVEIKKSTLGKIFYQGKMDYWYFFLHLSIDIGKSKCLISFIVPSYWLSSTGSSVLLERVKNNCNFTKIVEFGENKIFKDVSGRHMIFVLTKPVSNVKLESQKFTKKSLTAIELEKELASPDKSSVISLIEDSSKIFSIDMKVNIDSLHFQDLFQKIERISGFLEDETQEFQVSQGIVEAPDCVNQSISERVKDYSRLGQGVFVINKAEFDKYDFNKEELLYIKKYLSGGDVGRYKYDYSDLLVFYISSSDNKMILSNRRKFPNITGHLDQYKKFITSSNKPYGIHRTRNQEFFTQPKIIGKNMFDRPLFTYCEDEYYVNFAFNVIIRNNSNYDLLFLLGLLNSKLASFWFNIKGKKRGVNVDIGVGLLRQFPLVRLNLSEGRSFDKYNKVVILVEDMLKLQCKNPMTPREQHLLKQQIEATDIEIDHLVYELYDLTDEDIRIVEESA